MSPVADPPEVLPERREAPLMDRLQEQPFIDRVNPRTLELVQKSRFKGLTKIEAAMALELAAHYDLDPFAGEIWATRGEGRDGNQGQLLIMVGRDGLRKIVQRNGLDMDGDVIREKDTFVVRRSPDRTRTIQHDYEGITEENRGPIVGAWAEVWDPDRRQRGFFVAPLAEYMPTSQKKLQYSPWGSQLSVMILAAAERQAARQATPLSGLLMEGEMDLNDERAAGAIDSTTAEDDAAVQAIIDSLPVGEELRDRLYAAVTRANQLAPNSMPPMKVQLLVAEKADDEDALLREVVQIEQENEVRAQRREDAEARRAAAEKERAEREPVDLAEGEPPVEDAVVVDGPEGPEPEPEADEAAAASAEARTKLEAEVEDIEAAIDALDPEDDADKEQKGVLEASLKLKQKQLDQLG